MTAPHTSRAFTLVELLVALFVTAVMFAMGYGAISQALEDRAAVEERQDRVTAVQKAMALLALDFTQLAPRPVREPVGGGWQPSLEARAGDPALVSFSRAGWANPAGIQRPALQRVRYVLEDGTLRREHAVVLDATLSSRIVQRELLEDVEAVTFRFMDGARQWRTEWPPQGPNPPEFTLRARPIAVEVTVELEDWGRLMRIIEVGG